MLQVLSLQSAEKIPISAVQDKKEREIVLSSFKTQPVIQKPEEKAVPKVESAVKIPAVKTEEPKKEKKAGFFSSLFQKKPKTEQKAPVAAVTKANPAVLDSFGIKKTLPTDIKSTFEKSSADFTTFAQKKEGKESLDEWDRAILFGEYPGGRIPMEIKGFSKAKNETEKSAGDAIKKVPAKPAQEASAPMQGRINEPENVIAKEVPKNIKPIEIKPITFQKNVPMAPNGTTVLKPLPSNIAVPQKTNIELSNPKGPEPTADVTGNIIIRPDNRPRNTEERLSFKSAEEILKKKKIQEKISFIFSGAPEETYTFFKNTLAKELIGENKAKLTEEMQKGEWGKHLKDFVAGMRARAIPLVGTAAEPKEDELAFDYAERIFPIASKDEIS